MCLFSDGIRPITLITRIYQIFASSTRDAYATLGINADGITNPVFIYSSTCPAEHVEQRGEVLVQAFN
jgi:hypothetical protein